MDQFIVRLSFPHPLLVRNGHVETKGVREREANWSMVISEKAAPVSGTTSRFTGPVPADSRQ